MKYTRLFLVRHGETEYNKNGLMQGRGIDAPLNEDGKHQAQMVAKFLETEGAGEIISSSMRRAIETAVPLSENTGQNIQSYGELDEMNFGHLEGKKTADVQEELHEIHKRWASGDIKYAIPGGESPAEVFERADSRIRCILNSGGHQTKVFILHGRLIRILLSKWLGYGLKNMHKIKHQNGAINHIVKNDVSFNIVYLNKTDHLVQPSE